MSRVTIGLRRPIKTTRVYDTYWRFAAARQRAFFEHLAGSDVLTDDPIIANHRFTNAYRASDRVSQYLIQHVIYEGDLEPEEVFFRTLLFRIFNKIDTWKRLTKRFRAVTWREFSYRAYDAELSRIMRARKPIYSAAYIMPSRAGRLRSPRKHRNHLQLLAMMMRDGLVHRLMGAKRAADAFLMLRSYPMIGDFLGYQFFTDLNYGPLLDFSEMDFVIPGPGAASGLRKCIAENGGMSDSDLIRLVTDMQEDEFASRGVDFSDLWGRPLQLIDCQNLFCEVDKYARVAHPQVKSGSGRSQIKQKYRRSTERLRVWYPPKWGINENIPAEMRASTSGGQRGL